MKNTIIVAGGLDPSGGAGLSADIKTASFFQCYPLPIATCITYQNPTRFKGFEPVSSESLKNQINSIIKDFTINFAKIGMTGNASNLFYLLSILNEHAVKIILDPVINPSAGGQVMDTSALEFLKKNLLKVFMLTPNIPEAQVLVNDPSSSPEKLGLKIAEYGCKYVLVKGGHSNGDCSDFLIHNKTVTVLQGDRLKTDNTRGTGCTLSTAVASLLASGLDIENACKIAKQYLTKTMEHDFKPGDSPYPLNHLLL